MRDSAITDYFKAIKQEPVFETEALNLNTSLEYTSTEIKNEQQCYIKEEIDIPNDIINTDSDCDSFCIKPCPDLANQTCSIVINRLSDAVLQKYLKNENQSEEIIEASDSLNKDNVENSATKNQRIEIKNNNDKSDSRKRKRSDITELHTSMNIEYIENVNADAGQKEIIEDNGGEKVRSPTKDEPEVAELGKSSSKENIQTSYMEKKQKEIIQNTGEKKLRNHEKTNITKFVTSLNKETIPLLQNSDTNNRQNKNIESNDEKDGKERFVRYSSKDGPLSTELYRSFCPKCEKTCKTRTATVRCSDCKSRLMYECNKCRKQLGSHAGIGSHVRGSCMSQGYYYECFKCGFKSPLRSYVLTHIKRVHPNSFHPERIKRIASKEIRADVAPEIDECSKCGQQFFALHKLMKHVQTCNGSKNSEEYTSDYAASKNKILRQCSKCDKTIKDVGNDKKLCTKCQIVLAFKCSVCQKLYTSCGGIINHIVKSHFVKDLRCPKCDFKSGSMSCLTSHYKRMHNPKVFQCTKCRTTLKSREHLSRHLKKCGMKPHLNCAHCSYKTCVRLCLRMHLLNVHSQEDGSEDQSIACPKCQRIYKNDVLLKKHLKTTCEKEARFQCEHCSLKTKFKRSLERHLIRRHSAGRKYECSKCKYQFKNNTSLVKHVLACGIERSLQCQLCSFKTFKEQYLRCHIRNKHQNDYGTIS